MRVVFVAAAMLVGCASAGGGEHIVVPDGSNGGGQHDAPMNSQADASPDAPNGMATVTIGETTNNTLDYGGSFACASNANGNTTDNIWYRAFQLSDYNITNAFTITSVSFAVQDAVSSPPITVKVYNYTGALDGATVTAGSVLGMGTVTPPNTSGMAGETATVNLTAAVAAGGKFLVEVSAPDVSGSATQQAFYIGATSSAETHKGYWSSAGCSQTTPETMQVAGQSCTPTACPVGQLIINVTGTH